MPAASFCSFRQPSPGRREWDPFLSHRDAGLHEDHEDDALEVDPLPREMLALREGGGSEPLSSLVSEQQRTSSL